MVVGTVVIYLFMLMLNEWLFTRSEFIRGVNWIYLPAGVRLLCVLLFGLSGAVGVLIASWLACIYYYFPDDFIRSAAGTAISAGAPYLIYLMARRSFGLRSSLANLTPLRLFLCVLAYALANTLLHHSLFILLGTRGELLPGLFIMFIGDLSGSLAVIYTMKYTLYLTRRKV